MPALVERRQQRIAARQLGRDRGGQRRQRIGHVIRPAILFAHQPIRQRHIFAERR